MQPQTAPAEPDPPDREAELWRTFKQDGSVLARERLFSLYVPLARRIARQHFLDRKSGAVEFADLCQLAYAGLLETIDRFDPTFGVSFARYAQQRISGSVLDGLRQASELREQMSFRKRVRRERAKSFAADDIDTLTASEALDRLVDAAVGLALGFMLEGTDIFVPEGSADRRPNAYESAAWSETLRGVAAELDRLPDRERLIIHQHYLNGLDFDHIGRLLQVSKGRVSQLHRAALERLRDQLQKTGQFSLER